MKEIIGTQAKKCWKLYQKHIKINDNWILTLDQELEIKLLCFRYWC